MILTFTPNPAIDISGIVQELVPNEKAYVFNEKRFPGGNGINAARIAHRLGAKVLATGFLGGSSGKEFWELLKQENIPQKFINIKDRTRTNLTVSLENSHEQTRLSFPGPKITAAELKKAERFLKKSNPDIFILGGSLPLGFDARNAMNIVKDFNHRKILTFVDVPGKILKEVMSIRPTFIKPNLSEFQELVGKKVSTIIEVIIAARKLSPLIPIQCISSVENGALLITKDHIWFGTIPNIKIQSTVGAGDSMVGAMAYVLGKHRGVIDETSSKEMLRYGLAAATATLACKGLTMGTKQSISQYLTKIGIKK